MVSDTLIIGLIILNIAQLYFSNTKDKRQEAMIDKLTSKIKASTLEDYTINLPKKKTINNQPVKVGGKPVNEIVPIEKAHPEEIMQALARQAGRSTEFEVDEF